ncbi:e3 ubiquitin-protein ligase hrd-1 [Quercus suber]|uniref:E3 ubiquitin-protein ligase hrd-1 n=2 Tax=Quercus suber TaxID=58331 RepID=A0AAW0KNH6_QUESU
MVENFKNPPTNLLTLKVPTQILQCPPCHQHYLLGKISALNLLDASKVQRIVSTAQDIAATGTGYFIVAELEILRVEVVNVYDLSNFIESTIESLISKASIDKLVRRGSFVAGSKSQELDLGTCTICLEEFSSSPEAKLIRMDCSHVYHLACMYPWLENRGTTCPCCRFNIN